MAGRAFAMNDDFLQRLREAPRAEFLAELKARLDRQPRAVPPRRASFARGLLTGMLLATAGFALAAATFGVPDSLRVLVRSPVQFLARVFPGGGGSDPAKSPEHRHIVPLGPVWVPTHPASPSTTNVEIDKAAFTASSSVAAVAASSSHPTQSGTSAPATELTVFTSAATYPLARTIGAFFARSVNVEPQLDGAFAELLCRAHHAEVLEVSRRLSDEELRTCAHVRNDAIIEARIGYQVIVLARASLYGPMNLSARELFLALARRVPDPNHPDALIENPYYNWNQINPALPYDPIKVLGPEPTSLPGRLATELLLNAGCDSYPRFAALRTSDPQAYTNFCSAVRTDGIYVTNNLPSGALVDQLSVSPWIVGVFSLPEFEGSKKQLAQITLEGTAASKADLTSAAYPAARTLYVYANRNSRAAFLSRDHLVLRSYLRMAMEPASLNAKEPVGWGFVPLDAADRQATLDMAAAFELR
jgi:phosphate transport system substrate-binding protein